MSKLIRKAVKLLEAHGYTVVKRVKHGTRHYHANGNFVQIGSTPRTEAFLNDVKQHIARHLGIKKSTL